MKAVYLTDREVKTAVYNANRNGENHIDHLGKAAVSMLLTGNIEAYEKATRNAFPHEGSDLVGVKATVNSTRGEPDDKENDSEYYLAIVSNIDNIVYVKDPK